MLKQRLLGIALASLILSALTCARPVSAAVMARPTIVKPYMDQSTISYGNGWYHRQHHYSRRYTWPDNNGAWRFHRNRMYSGHPRHHWSERRYRSDRGGNHYQHPWAH